MFPKPAGGVMPDATVVAVRVAVALLPPVGVIEFGEIEHILSFRQKVAKEFERLLASHQFTQPPAPAQAAPASSASF